MSSRLEKKKPVSKNEPGMLQLTVTLCAICAVCALALGLTNMVTEPVIAANAEAKKTAAIAAEVLPGFTGTLTQVNYVGSDATVKSVQKGSEGSYVVEVSPKSSFQPGLTLLIGIDPEGKIAGISVVQSSETEGIGSKALESAYLQAQYVGKTGPVELTKNGGDVEGITGASYTSGAVKDAVNSAVEAIGNTNDAPFDPSLVPATPEPAAVSENIISMAREGDGYVAVVDCGPDSFSRNLKIQVNIGADKAVAGVTILESDETEGFGAKASEPEFIDQFVGVSGTVALTRDGGEIETITGASTTSNAICVGVTAALQAIDYPDQWPQGTVDAAGSGPADGVSVQSVEPSGDGHAVTVDCSALGFPGATLILRVDIDANKAVAGIEVVDSTQTEGIGSNALTAEHFQQFIGKSGTVEVDGVAGATYTSDAVSAGVNAALKAVDTQG